MKVTETSHKARGGALGSALAAILVWIGKQYGVDLGPIGDPIALVITTLLGGGIGAWISPANKPKLARK